MSIEESSVVDRWLQYSPGELAVVQAGLALLIDGIQAEAEQGLPESPELRERAAATFLAAATICFQIDVVLGVEHPPADFTVAVASMIRSGEYRAFAQGNGDVSDPAEDGASASTVEAA